MNTKRVYLIGDAFGSYRARCLIEQLLSSGSYATHYADPRYLVSIKRKFLNRAVLKIYRGFDRIYNLIKFILADVLYVLPMGNLKVYEFVIAKVLNKKVITEFYISQYDTFVNDRKTVEKNSRKANSLLKSDQRLIDVSDHLIFLNESERFYYLGLANRIDAKQKSSVFPLITPDKARASQPYAHGLTDALTMCWWGTYIPLHGLEKIIKATAVLKSLKIKCNLYIFGTSDEKSRPYQSLIEELDISDMAFIDNILNFSDKSLEKFLKDKCDIAFGNFGDSDKAKTVMVNKVLEASSMGLPVMSQKTKALAEFFTDNTDIFYCEPTPEGIAEKVLELSSQREKQQTVAQEALERHRTVFSKDAYLSAVMGIMDSVLEPNRTK